MAKCSPYHTITEEKPEQRDVYHDHSDCPDGKSSQKIGDRVPPADCDVMSVNDSVNERGCPESIFPVPLNGHLSLQPGWSTFVFDNFVSEKSQLPLIFGFLGNLSERM